MGKLRVVSFISALALCITFGTSVRAQKPEPILTVTDYSIFVDGVPQAERVGTMGGKLFWFSLPQQGQFIVSLEPHPDYKFEKIARVAGNTISFSLEGKLYQWASTASILEDGSELDMWVLRDTEFQPKNCGKRLCAGSNSSFEYFLKHREREESR